MSEFRIAIDESALDTEWRDQPEMYYETAEQYAGAKYEADRLSNELKLVASDVEFDIRKNPGKYGLEKVTEAVVTATVTKNAAYQEAMDAWRKQKHEVDILSGALEALNHRRKALENLVTLHCANYYSTPRVTGEAGEQRQERLKKKVRKGIKKRQA